MKIVLPGGTGQVGTVLARHFHGQGHDVTVLSRRPNVGLPWHTMYWDGKAAGDWIREFDGADAVINLAGRSVNCRYNARNRRAIMDSRVVSTRLVGRAIANCRRPPRVWLQMSTATIYTHRFDADNDEYTGQIGGTEPNAPETWRFSIDVARAWEEACDAAQVSGTRKVKLRLAMLMNADRRSTFDLLLRLVRYGLGGRAGDGHQFMSWIHEYDFVRAIEWLIERDDICGAVNVAAPQPLSHTDFMRALRTAWGMRWGLPATEWMLELGTRLMQTESELILKSRRVVPRRLLDRGFEFRFPNWPDAARDLCAKWRSQNSGIETTKIAAN